MVKAAETYGDFSYSVNGNAVTITGYSGSDSAVTIPSEKSTNKNLRFTSSKLWKNSGLFLGRIQRNRGNDYEIN